MNGVYLAGCGSSMKGAVHCGSHTRGYADMIEKRLLIANDRGARDEILKELDDIRRELLSGLISLNARGFNP